MHLNLSVCIPRQYRLSIFSANYSAGLTGSQPSSRLLLQSGSCPVTCCPVTLSLLVNTGGPQRVQIQSWTYCVNSESQSNNLLPSQCWRVTYAYTSTKLEIREVLISSLLSSEVLLDISNMNWLDANKRDFHCLLLFTIASFLNVHL